MFCFTAPESWVSQNVVQNFKSHRRAFLFVIPGWITMEKQHRRDLIPFFSKPYLNGQEFFFLKKCPQGNKSRAKCTL